MESSRRTLAVGGATFVVGLVLWLFTGDAETPVIALPKVGVVLMVVGGIEVAYGLYRGAAGGR